MTPIDLTAAAATLARGAIVVYPTETFYGLGARALDAAAVAAVAAVKGERSAKPIAVIIADETMLEALVGTVPAPAVALMERFWPGPLTLVLPARAGLAPELTAGTGTIGVRISSHPAAQTLAREIGGPITATSANRTGARPPTTLAAAYDSLGPDVAGYVDGGTLPGGVASTVLRITADRAFLLRAGAVGRDDLLAALGSTPLHDSDS